MEKSSKRDVLTALLRTLSAADTAWLRQKLLRRESAAVLQDKGRLSAQELLAVETWLWDKVSGSRSMREKQPRLRMWLIFMLLRYGALRLVEIFSLTPDRLDLQKGCLHIDGDHARDVPLPMAVSRRLRRVLEDPRLFPADARLLQCDSSYVRRCLQQCGAACGLPKGMLSARSLRHSRALELGRQGLPLPVVDFFLGRRQSTARNGMVRCDPDKARQLLYEQIQRERPVKTSARNVFQGRIISLRPWGLMVEVVLRTAGGLEVMALITDESFRALGLAEGTLVNASVKAPWVLVQAAPATALVPCMENHYTATVERVRQDDMLMEIQAALPDGSQVCALQSRPQTGTPFKAGDKISVQFKAFAVILTLD